MNLRSLQIFFSLCIPFLFAIGFFMGVKKSVQQSSDKATEQAITMRLATVGQVMEYLDHSEIGKHIEFQEFSRDLRKAGQSPISPKKRVEAIDDRILAKMSAQHEADPSVHNGQR